MVKNKPHLLGNCKNEHKFVLKDGKQLNSLYEMVMAMESMNKDVYGHHVNESKNDFASWIKDVYQEPELAENVSKAQNKTEAQLEILKAIVNRVRK